MAGKIRQMIDSVIAQRAMGNPMMEKIIKTKLILKGVNPNKYTLQSDDDPLILEKIERMLTELGQVAKAPANASAPVAGNVSVVKDAPVVTPAVKKIDTTDIITAYSTKETVDEIVKDISHQVGFFDTKLLLFFASSKFAPDDISLKMQETFPFSSVFGCSTSGEIVSGQMLDNSVVAMAFNSQAVKDSRIEVIENLQDEQGVKRAFDSFEKHFETPMTEMNSHEYVGLILVDGLSGAEEKLIETIGDMTNVVFIGGSAGDDLKFTSTSLYAKGECYSNGAVLALLKPGKEFTFIKTQSFCNLGKRLEVTKADEKNRIVYEFNGKPAAVAYAETVGTSVEDASKYFMHNPVGLVIENEPYVRSPQQIKENGSMAFYCGVGEGMELSLLESTNIIEDTRNSVKHAVEELGKVSGIINFNCILRTLELKQKNLTREYGELFSAIPTIGFSTYGEQYIGHINQTATMLVFK
jgi:hypothetical protein